jgi:hypothetical protein
MRVTEDHKHPQHGSLMPLAKERFIFWSSSNNLHESAIYVPWIRLKENDDAIARNVCR